MYNDYFGVCGFVDRGDGVSGADGNAYRTDGDGEYKYHPAGYHRVCSRPGFLDHTEYGWDGGGGDIEHIRAC